MNKGKRYLKFKQFYNERTQKEKTGIKIAAGFLLFCGFLTVMWIVGMFIELFERKKLGAMYYGFHNGFFVSLILYVILLALMYFTYFYESRQNEVEQITKDNTFILKNKQGGRRRWIELSEIEANFYHGPPEDAPNTILGKSPYHEGWVVALPKLEPDANHNELIVALMGRGKTVAYVMNILIQSCLKKISFICNDPKAEVFAWMSHLCSKITKHNTHVLNLANLDRSEFWNCLRETIDPETERLDALRLDIFVDTFMANSGDEEDKNFWYASAVNLVKAVVGLVSWQYESAIVNNYKALYKQITGLSDNHPDLVEMDRIDCPFPWMQEKIRKAAHNHGVNETYVESCIQKIAQGSPEYKYTLGDVFDKIMAFATIEEVEWKELPREHPGRTFYDMYKSNKTPQVQESAIQGAQMRFKLFANVKLKELLSRDGINLNEINQIPSAFFVVTSDKSETLRPIASLFFSFFYKDAMDTFDAFDQQSKDKGVENPCLPVVALLEEFSTLGVITGDARLYGKYMATSRSRKIYNKIIIQHYSQLEELYGENLKDGIESACENLIFLGCKDNVTAKWIEERIGTATVLAESHAEGTGLLSSYVDKQSSMGAVDVPLVYAADALAYPLRQALIQYADQYPMELKTFHFKEHPAFKEGLIQYSSTYSQVELLRDRLEKIKEIENKNVVTQSQIKNMISQIHSNVDLSTGEVLDVFETTEDDNSFNMSDIFDITPREDDPTEELPIIDENEMIIEPVTQEETNSITKEINDVIDEVSKDNPFEVKEEPKEVKPKKPKGRKTMNKKKKSLLED